MAKSVWSFNTTVRNPERMEHMLRALLELEGVEFDEAGQRTFFGLQIKKRLYKPTASTLEEKDLVDAVHADNSADDLDDELVERILAKYDGRDVDGAGRGRTAAGILNRFGLCVALQSKGSVVITELGKKWLEHQIDDEELFTKFFLKWQYPNKIEGDYKGFDIKPFVGTLALIKSVNSKWEALGKKPVGLSMEEYELFVPALSVAAHVEDYANQIIDYRKEKQSKSGVEKAEFMKDFATARAAEIFGDSKDLAVGQNDLRDYRDSSIRYFRVSGLLALRGEDTHVDIAKDKEVEVASLLDAVSSSAEDYDSYEEYLEYLSDINSLVLPWQNEADLQKIVTELSASLRSESTGDVAPKLAELSVLPTPRKVDALKEALNEQRIKKLVDLKHDVVVLDECIDKISNIMHRSYETLTARPSLDLEWYVSRALLVLNDAIKIQPSYKIGDDGIPTGFRANVSDIECVYETFGMTVEVTLLIGRDQWVAEGQPVMRHLRDFEERLKESPAYCVFVAPIIHRDALNTFWNSNKFGYEGQQRQNIIPLTLVQFVAILKIARAKIEGGTLSHRLLKTLLDSISRKTDSIDVPQNWVNTFPELIQGWAEA